MVHPKWLPNFWSRKLIKKVRINDVYQNVRPHHPRKSAHAKAQTHISCVAHHTKGEESKVSACCVQQAHVALCVMVLAITMRSYPTPWPG